MLAQIFDGNATAYLFEAEVASNGGATETVKIKDATVFIATGKTIACLPETQLSEATLTVDLNNDGDTEDVLSLDQRGANRNLTGKACIGSYEYYVVETGIKPIRKANVISFDNRQLYINTAADFVCFVYDISGRKHIETDKNTSRYINLSSLSKGVYIVKVKYQGEEAMKKIIL